MLFYFIRPDHQNFILSEFIRLCLIYSTRPAKFYFIRPHSTLFDFIRLDHPNVISDDLIWFFFDSTSRAWFYSTSLGFIPVDQLNLFLFDLFRRYPVRPPEFEFIRPHSSLFVFIRLDDQNVMLFELIRFYVTRPAEFDFIRPNSILLDFVRFYHQN